MARPSYADAPLRNLTVEEAFPLSTKREDLPMRKFISAIAALLIGAGMTSAQQPPLDAASPNMTQPNTSVSETTGQPPKFEDRWSAQGETLDRPPITTMSDANTPSTTGQVPKPPLDQGNGNWDPPPVTAPSTTSSGTTGQDPSVIDETNDPDGTKAAARTVPAGPE